MLKKYFLILSIIILSVPYSSNAQWQQVLNRSIYSIYCNDSVILAGTNPAGLYRSTNNGLNWTNIYNSTLIFDITLNNSNIYIGNGERLTRTTNNGSSWDILFELDFVYDLNVKDSVFLIGVNNSGIFRSTNQGLNWITTNMQTQSVRSIVRKGNKIFAGTVDDGLFVSSNNGVNWSQGSITSTYVPGLNVIGNNLYAGIYDQGLYISTNDGLNWQQTSFDSGYVKSIIPIGNSIFITDGLGIFRSEDYFQNWTNLTDNLPFGPIVDISYDSIYMYAALMSGVYRRALSEVTGINIISNEIPSIYSLHQNFPNPFNPSTKITFDVVKKGNVSLVIYDHLGREIATILNEELSPGIYEKEFDGSNFSSGIYYYKLITREFSETKKMVLVK